MLQAGTTTRHRPGFPNPVRDAILIISCALPVCLAAADTVWQWTDASGQVTFSDTPPPQAELVAHELFLEYQAPGPASGLRPGEREALLEMERRQAIRQRELQAARQRNDRKLAAQRDACRAARERLQQTRDREQRKLHSAYLGKHCW